MVAMQHRLQLVAPPERPGMQAPLREMSRALAIRWLAYRALTSQLTARHGKAAALAVAVPARLSQTLVAVPDGVAAAEEVVGITTQRLLSSRPRTVD